MNPHEDAHEDGHSIGANAHVEDVSEQNQQKNVSLHVAVTDSTDATNGKNKESRRNDEDKRVDSTARHNVGQSKPWEVTMKWSDSQDADIDSSDDERNRRMDLDSDESSPEEDLDDEFDFYSSMFQHSDSSSDDGIEGYDVTQKIEVIFDEEESHDGLISAMAKQKLNTKGDECPTLVKSVSFKSPLVDEKEYEFQNSEPGGDEATGNTDQREAAVTEIEEDREAQDRDLSSASKPSGSEAETKEPTVEKVVVVEDIFTVPDDQTADSAPKSEPNAPRVSSRMKRYLEKDVDSELDQLVKASKKRTRPSIENAFTPPGQAVAAVHSTENKTTESNGNKEDLEPSQVSEDILAATSTPNVSGNVPMEEDVFLTNEDSTKTGWSKPECDVINELEQLAKLHETFNEPSTVHVAATSPNNAVEPTVDTGTTMAALAEGDKDDEIEVQSTAEADTEQQELLTKTTASDETVQTVESPESDLEGRPKHHAATEKPFKRFLLRLLRYCVCCNVSPSSYIM